MRSAAELYRIAVADHAYVISVLFSEKGHGAHGASLGYRHVTLLVAADRLADKCVGAALDLADLLLGHFLEMREVEAKDFRRYERTFLLHVCAEHFAQGVVEKVCRRVVA